MAIAGQITSTTNVGSLSSIIPNDICSRLGLSKVYNTWVVSSTITSFLQLERGFYNAYWLFDRSKTTAFTCLPQNYIDAVSGNLSPIFSPATACPDGYAPMCTLVAIGATVTAAPTVRLWTALATNDAAIGCCPSGYACADEAGFYSCVSTFKPGETIQADLLWESSATTTIYGNAQTTISAFALKLIYASAQPTPQPSTPPPRTESTQPSSQPHTASPQPNTHTSSGLSLGQKAAIGVCVPLAVLSLLIGLLFIRRRNRRRTAAQKTQTQDVAADSHQKPELDGLSRPRGPLELDASSGSPGGANTANKSQFSMGLSEAERQHVSPHEIAELPGSGVVVPPPELPPRNSPVIQRKPVSGGQYSLTDHQPASTTQDASDRVVSEISCISADSRTYADGIGRAMESSDTNPESKPPVESSRTV